MSSVYASCWRLLQCLMQRPGCVLASTLRPSWQARSGMRGGCGRVRRARGPSADATGHAPGAACPRLACRQPRMACGCLPIVATSRRRPIFLATTLAASRTPTVIPKPTETWMSKTRSVLLFGDGSYPAIHHEWRHSGPCTRVWLHQCLLRMKSTAVASAGRLLLLLKMRFALSPLKDGKTILGEKVPPIRCQGGCVRGGWG